MKILSSFFMIILFISLASALSVDIPTSTNYSEVNVNNSDYLDGKDGTYYLDNTDDQRLDEIDDPDASKTFSMGGNTINWRFTNPVGGMLFEMTGGWSGHVLEILDTANGDGSAGDHLLHLNSSRLNVITAHIINHIGKALLIEGDSEFIGDINITGDVSVKGEVTTNDSFILTDDNFGFDVGKFNGTLFEGFQLWYSGLLGGDWEKVYEVTYLSSSLNIEFFAEVLGDSLYFSSGLFDTLRGGVIRTESDFRKIAFGEELNKTGIYLEEPYGSGLGGVSFGYLKGFEITQENLGDNEIAFIPGNYINITADEENDTGVLLDADLGQEDKPFRNVWSNYLHGDGSNITGIDTTHPIENVTITASAEEINVSVNGSTDYASSVTVPYGTGQYEHNVVASQDKYDYCVSGGQNGALSASANDGFQFSEGNGEEGIYSNRLALCDGIITAFALMPVTSTTTGTTVNVTINGNPTLCGAKSSGVSQSKGSTASYSYTDSCEIPINKWDGIGFEITASDGSTTTATAMTCYKCI